MTDTTATSGRTRKRELRGSIIQEERNRPKQRGRGRNAPARFGEIELAAGAWAAAYASVGSRQPRSSSPMRAGSLSRSNPVLPFAARAISRCPNRSDGRKPRHEFPPDTLSGHCLPAFICPRGRPVRARTCSRDQRTVRGVPAICQSPRRRLRSADAAPATLGDWNRQRAELRANLLKAWGGFPAEPCALNPKKLGELQREGYRVEKLIFQTRPNVWMTANAYVPDRPGKLPTVLCVHGHWRGAKQDPVVQSRCIGLAKLGFFVLVVDAFGAGERGVGKALGEYHGEMTAATLFPVGLPLSGLQVYENMRAVDYLLTRPEVDGARLGITGASGGGNQSMYAGAFDERFKAVVPVCSVGNYQAYLGAACCMCEVVPGALRFTEEWGLLSLVAPRALMVVSATKDAFNSPSAKRRSLSH